jgi:hypothetical protein
MLKIGSTEIDRTALLNLLSSPGKKVGQSQLGPKFGLITRGTVPRFGGDILQVITYILLYIILSSTIRINTNDNVKVKP